MEQEDYILREIEKIGIILRYIREKLFPGKGIVSTSTSEQLHGMKEIVLTETGLDIDKFLSLNVEDSNEYINSIKGYNSVNIELLAGCISQICLQDSTAASKKHLEMALQLYELSNRKNQTYSLERENAIMSIKNAL
jgi:hypothetical protein